MNRNNDDLPRLPPRAPDSHKGDFGRALLIGGSTGMAGSISLSGMAALRSGAGLVKLAVPEACLATVAAFEPSYMTIPLPCDAAGRIARAARDAIADAAGVASVVACGPGLGRSDDLTELVGSLYQELEQAAVFDADALNALAAQKTVLSQRGGPRILTPHPGEFSRLTGHGTPKPEEREPLARQLAKESGAIIVLKGHHTVVTDGQRLALGTTGNPGMSTGGTGDVLTGVITALLCQGLEPYDAARLGVHVHGLAGDLAAEELGQVGMTAHDLVDFLPPAFLRLRRDHP